MKLFSRIRLFATPWTIAYQASLSMGFSRQEYWSELPFILQEIFLTQGLNPGLLHCKQTLYHLSHEGRLPSICIIPFVCYICSYIFTIHHIEMDFPHGLAGKESACNVGDLGLIPRLGRSPGEGNGYPLQYYGLENSPCIVHGVAKSRTRLSDFHFHIETNIYTAYK